MTKMQALDKLKRGAKERPWKPEHDATLVAMKAAGMTITAIGERLGRTPQAVSSRIYNLGADDRPIDKALSLRSRTSVKTDWFNRNIVAR